MDKVWMTLDACRDLGIEVLTRHGCDQVNARAIAANDIVFHGYKDGVLTLHLQGACSSCPSATLTLKMGVENRLKSLFPEIKEVVQI